MSGAADVVRSPSLGATLRRIASEGIAAFYSGDVAADIVATACAAGSRVTARDLAAYQVIERTPLHAIWEGFDVYTMPPESAGGLMLLETLSMYSRANLRALGLGTGGYFHVLAESFRGALADRVRFIGDPAFVRQDAAALTNSARMRARQCPCGCSTRPRRRSALRWTKPGRAIWLRWTSKATSCPSRAPSTTRSAPSWSRTAGSC